MPACGVCANSGILGRRPFDSRGSNVDDEQQSMVSASLLLLVAVSVAWQFDIAQTPDHCIAELMCDFQHEYLPMRLLRTFISSVCSF